MRQKEPLDIRLQRRDMHDYFKQKIDIAINNKQYIEACWLVYSCMENRYFRTIEKIKPYCLNNSKKCRKSDNQLALRTKVKCIQHLLEAGDSCFVEAFDNELIERTLQWIKRRNKLMHNLISLETYQNMDHEFSECAKDGLLLLNATYKCCTKFRKYFYKGDYEFCFPKAAMEKCACCSKNRSDPEE